jgi:hypothetical protein
MITGTLKSKIDKLWLEFWASATLPRCDPGGYLCCHCLLLGVLPASQLDIPDVIRSSRLPRRTGEQASDSGVVDRLPYTA